MKKVLLLSVIIFLTSCTITKYIPSKVYSECDYFSEKSPQFSVELTSSSSNNDSIFCFQLIKKHTHNQFEISGNEKFTSYSKNAIEAKGITYLSILNAGLWAFIDKDILLPWFGGLGVLLTSWSWIRAKINPDYSELKSEGMLKDVVRTPVIKKNICPITKIFCAQADLKISYNNKTTNLKSDQYGKFSLNLKEFLGYKSGNIPYEITLKITSESLNMSDSIILRNFGGLNPNNIAQWNTNLEFETNEQYLFAEKVLWNSSLKNNAVSIKKGIYYFPASTERKLVLAQIKNQRLLCFITNEIEDFEIRKLSFNKLDNNSLLYLTQLSNDQGLVLASKLKLNLLTWNEVFRNMNKTNNELRNIITAASIINTPQPNEYDIVSVCHKYIRLGDSSRIPELINLLNRFGNETLAEDYMNCGQSTLSDAGCAWGRAHGYRCTTGNYGSNRVRWGVSK